MRKIILCMLSIVIFSTSLQAESYGRKVLKNAYVSRRIPIEPDDSKLVERIVKAYRVADKQHLGSSIWQAFFDQRHKPIHDVFQSEDLIKSANVLRNPSTNDLFYGIDNLCSSILPIFDSLDIERGHSLECFSDLIRFGKFIGAVNLDYPESHPQFLAKSTEVKIVIDQLEKFLGVTLNFPNPYSDEYGAWTPRGVVSYRVPQALYQAYLIKKLLKGIPNPKVLEIGAGVGRTAYYARLFGIEDYTIIDIPIVAAASSYFLGRTLGQDQILLLGEKSETPEKKVKILTPDQFVNKDGSYDLIINVDSLTEMDVSIAKSYINKNRKKL